MVERVTFNTGWLDRPYRGMLVRIDGTWHEPASYTFHYSEVRHSATTRCGKGNSDIKSRDFWSAPLDLMTPFERPGPECAECDTLPPFFAT